MHSGERVSYDSIQERIRIAEWKFSQVDIQKFKEELVAQEWSLDYIYLDRKKNMYEFKLEHVETVSPPPPNREDTTHNL